MTDEDRDEASTGRCDQVALQQQMVTGKQLAGEGIRRRDHRARGVERDELRWGLSRRGEKRRQSG